MAIRKRPLNLEQEAKIHEIIQKGGSPSTVEKQIHEPYKLSLRIPVPLKNQVEEIISLDPTQPSLTAWILEAMKRRLQSEKQNGIN